jgi:hypothetical protein
MTSTGEVRFAVMNGHRQFEPSGPKSAKTRHLDLEGPSTHANSLHQESCVDALILLNDMTSFPRENI